MIHDRARVALSLGYIDARFMVHLKETHGYPLAESAMQATRAGLKVDYAGLEHELLRIGKNETTVRSELDEVRFFVAIAIEHQPHELPA